MAVFREPRVMRTPFEVLGLIFELCVGQDLSEMDQRDVLQRVPQRPFILAGVCKQWHRAALLHPRVWANINLSLLHVKSKNVPTWRSYLSTMISRSGKAPLALRITRRGRESKKYDAQLVRKLLPELHRCHWLHIGIHLLFTNDDTALPILHARFPTLRQLHLDVGILSDSVDLTRFLPYTPLLRSLTGEFPFHSSDTLHMPQLLTASLQSCSMLSVAALLGSAPSLQTLNFDTGVFFMFRLPPLSTECISGVENLTIICDAYGIPPMVEFARYVRFTALTSLTLSGQQDGAEARLTFFAHAAEHMGSTLTSLRAELNNRIGEALRLLLTGLSFCSQLASLELSALFGTKSQLAELCEFLSAPPEGMPWACPQLHSIDLRGCSFEKECDEGAIAEMLKRRLEAANDDATPVAVRPKRISRVVNPRYPSSALVAAIRALLLPKPENGERSELVT
ncbi:hypothetical protein EXIGLDRAFT_769905 [Exidia glandulosa HHB12029]|uniref:F-box domain-containing protein n=1 Tax=Exidia glandulosa HHB12029 TaxID=1314781 RepID=A0A165H533_EXIGL|nr:hypothetical protein EXIGLDRAFT_769905 [Exidia glandulosa HHB12029]